MIYLCLNLITLVLERGYLYALLTVCVRDTLLILTRLVYVLSYDLQRLCWFTIKIDEHEVIILINSTNNKCFNVTMIIVVLFVVYKIESIYE